MNALPTAQELPVPADRKRFSVAQIVRVLIGLGLLTCLGVGLDWGQVSSCFAQMQFAPFGIAALLAFISYGLCIWRWHLLLRARRIAIGFQPLLRIQLTAAFVGSFLPSSLGVDALRMVAISRHTDRPMEAVGTSAVDRALMVSVTFLFASVTSWCAVGRYFPATVACTVSVFLFALLVTGAFIVYGNDVSHLSPTLSRVLGNGLTVRLASLHRSIQAFRGHSLALLTCSAMAFATLFLRVVIVCLEARAIGVNVDFISLLLVFPVVWIAVMLPISIGGFGLQEGTYLVVLGQLGVDPAVAVSISLLDQIVARLVCLPGLYYYLCCGISATPIRRAADGVTGDENAAR